MSMFAAKSDITMLTGKRTRDEQSAELAKKGVPFDRNSRGEILVLRSTIEQAMTGRKPRNVRGHNIGALAREKSTI